MGAAGARRTIHFATGRRRSLCRNNEECIGFDVSLHILPSKSTSEYIGTRTDER